MNLTSLLFLSLLTVLTSCNGQGTSQIANSTSSDQHSSIAIGDTVKELDNNIMLVYQDKKNNYWFGSWKDGVYRYDAKTILHFTTTHGLPHNRIDEIKEDRSGNIYFNTPEGISKFDGKNFTTLSISNSNKEWKLESDDLWFKCTQDSGGVYRYDGKSLHHLKFPKHHMEGEYFVVNEKLSWSPYDVYCVYKDSKGNIWFGTAVLGACRYDGKSFDWISEEDVTEFHDGPSNGVRSIIEDRDGYFWFNTMYRYNVYQHNTPEKSKPENQDQSKFSYGREKGIGSLDSEKDGDLVEYMSIARDNNNELWIATYGAGVWRYDPSGKLSTGRESIIHYPVKDGTKDITVFSIYKDNHGDLWLATHEWGAYKFNGKTFEKFRP